VLRQVPARMPVRRHGNWRHGDYSKARIEGMRATRACIRELRRLLPRRVASAGLGVALGVDKQLRRLR
jgi:hypothetical protein